mmetsp:Transcript_4985/g.7598  ORF Transcript_4985/g.7598 Transcript_4985/m.7598 type:complete len:487 (+) Transcript_4985:141-1601(+)
MGKKRRTTDSKRSVQSDEELEEDTTTLAFLFYAGVMVAFMAIGFYGGSNSNLQMSLSSLTWDAVTYVPLSIYSMGQSMGDFILSSSRGDDIYNAPHTYVDVNGKMIRDYASHPLVFAALRESILREGGFVHPDLGMINPAPSGAARGVGMVRDTYNVCQTRCMPRVAAEKNKLIANGYDEKNPPYWNASIVHFKDENVLRAVLDSQQSIDEKYRQEEYLIRVPLSYQMTRRLALSTLSPLIPQDVNQRTPLQELDDAALLVLLLAHERGLGPNSKFHPYIASLPVAPSCGYSPAMRPQALATIELMAIKLGMDVTGWPGEISKANDRAQMIADGLTKDYGPYIETTEGASTFSVIQWALCQVASRATAGSETHGALRLVPIVDMVNHDVEAGGFHEIQDPSAFFKGNADETDELAAGSFIVRSIRHGRTRPLKKGQELLVNYNVPDYSPLDWFISLGFIPKERMKKWRKVEPFFKSSRTYATNDEN